MTTIQQLLFITFIYFFKTHRTCKIQWCGSRWQQFMPFWRKALHRKVNDCCQTSSLGQCKRIMDATGDTKWDTIRVHYGGEKKFKYYSDLVRRREAGFSSTTMSLKNELMFNALVLMFGNVGDSWATKTPNTKPRKNQIIIPFISLLNIVKTYSMLKV